MLIWPTVWISLAGLAIGALAILPAALADRAATRQALRS
jgi:hypothetical protein